MVVAIAAPVLGLAVGLTLYAMRDAVVFFYGPSQARAEQSAGKLPVARTVRLGGLVQPGSVIKASNGEVRFSITDQAAAVPTTFKGELPDLFREGQGVVAQGEFTPDGGFVAREVLAKHDEKYMPKEVVDALKKSGQWRDGAPAKPVAQSSPLAAAPPAKTAGAL
jgi:cytochrome c-type biogenesis protein CcmE